MGPLLAEGSKKVFMSPCHHIFWPNADLVRKWLRNAGHIITTSTKDCEVQIAFLPKMAHTLNPVTTPTILICTEQPQSTKWPDKTFVSGIASFWCMDVVDLNFIRDMYDIPSHKLFVVPVMLGTYIQKKRMPIITKTVDVLHFGETNERREKAVRDIRRAVPDKMVVSTNNVWTDVLTALIDTARLVVVPHFFEEPNVFPLHRIMNVMQHHGVKVIVEESEGSVYTRRLLQQFGGRVVIAKYEDMPLAIQDALTHEDDSEELSEPACVQKLFAWDGRTSWLDVLE